MDVSACAQWPSAVSVFGCSQRINVYSPAAVGQTSNPLRHEYLYIGCVHQRHSLAQADDVCQLQPPAGIWKFTHRLQRFTEQYSVLGGHLSVYSAPGPVSPGLVQVVSVGLFGTGWVVTYRPDWPAEVLIANQCRSSPSASPTGEIHLVERGLRAAQRALATLSPDLIACVSTSRLG